MSWKTCFCFLTVFKGIMLIFIVLSNPCLGAAEIGARELSEKFNVVLIVVNVLRADHLACYGYEQQTSPEIDALADQSFVFTNAFAHAGYTLPNMMSIITSLYPNSHGVFDSYKDELSPRIHTLAEILKIYGYNTAWFSILHEPHLDIDIGFGRGYDHKGALDRNFNGKAQMLSWLEKNKDKSFFLALNTRHMHSPYLPLLVYKDLFKRGNKAHIIDNEKDLARATYFKILELSKTSGSLLSNVFDKDAIFHNEHLFNGVYRKEKIDMLRTLCPIENLHKLDHAEVSAYNSKVNISDTQNLAYLIGLYDACIMGVDQALIKPIISKLKELDVYKNTLIVITGDHGEMLGEHDILGHGFVFYDEVIHVPLIIKGTGFNKKVEIDKIVQSIDIMPTILDFLGISIPYHAQGKSLLPWMKGENTGIIHDFASGQTRSLAYMRSKDYKLIYFYPNRFLISGRSHLFHLNDDPKELNDLCIARPLANFRLTKMLQDRINALPSYVDKEYTFAPHIDKETQERILKTGYW